MTFGDKMVQKMWIFFAKKIPNLNTKNLEPFFYKNCQNFNLAQERREMWTFLASKNKIVLFGKLGKHQEREKNSNGVKMMKPEHAYCLSGTILNSI